MANLEAYHDHDRLEFLQTRCPEVLWGIALVGVPTQVNFTESYPGLPGHPSLPLEFLVEFHFDHFLTPSFLGFASRTRVLALTGYLNHSRLEDFLQSKGKRLYFKISQIPGERSAKFAFLPTHHISWAYRRSGFYEVLPR